MQARHAVATTPSPATKHSPEIGGCRRVLLGGLLCGGAALTAVAAPQIPLTLTAAQLCVKIGDARAAAAKPLSPEARDAGERSLARFYEATASLCGGNAPRGDERCLHNEYYNYLAHIPDSVYRVDGHVVYETAVYGLLWADDSLQEQDSERSLTWDLRVTWPRVDEPANRSNPLGAPRSTRWPKRRTRAWQGGSGEAGPWASMCTSKRSGAVTSRRASPRIGTAGAHTETRIPWPSTGRG